LPGQRGGVVLEGGDLLAELISLRPGVLKFLAQCGR
jgi:hypothetical protein